MVVGLFLRFLLTFPVFFAHSLLLILLLSHAQPYQDLLDWETFSIRVPEHRLMEVCSCVWEERGREKAREHSHAHR